MLSCYIAQTRHHTETLRDFSVHSAIHVVQKVEGFSDQLVAFRDGARLDLVLAGCVEVVGVGCL